MHISVVCTIKTGASLIPTALKNPTLASGMAFGNNRRKKKRIILVIFSLYQNLLTFLDRKIAIIFRGLKALYYLLENI